MVTKEHRKGDVTIKAISYENWSTRGIQEVIEIEQEDQIGIICNNFG